ncbi:MAG: hypothetical protein CVU52_07745 [Deltaproteobacteria bacterium HGW-Deltaproteobacteria-10]|nr:MAG: hypothetical protein CVU52_07745 [Deltaproteobacteria bacterium HGW-Deltaproteobacteria-10]
MVLRKIFFVCVLFILLFPALGSSEVKEFTHEVEDVVGKDQSQEAKEKYLVERAMRLALEEAGVYISSTTVVTNMQLSEDKVTAMTAGIAKVKARDISPRIDENKNIYIKVKVIVTVDTSILDKQIENLAKETATMRRLEEEVKKRASLEKELESLKKDDIKRLDQLNSQVIAIEQERQKQRIFREEQALKAKGELNKVQIERLNKEKELQERINKEIAEQEKKRREESEAIARESDRIKRAQLENDQRLSELARKAILKKQEWVAVDESLSIKQIIEESKNIKSEIANISRQLDIQFEKNKDNLNNVFNKQIELTVPQFPPDPGPKGDFETTAEYDQRKADHAAKVAEIDAANRRKIDRLNAELNYETAEATLDYLKQTVSILKDFVNRFNVLQQKAFILPEEKIEIELGHPDADKSLFPMTLKHAGYSIETSLKYADRSKADDLRKTKQFLHGEGTFKIAENVSVSYKTQSIFKLIGSLPTLIRGGGKVGSGVAKAKLFQDSDKNDVSYKLVKVKITHPAMDKPQEINLPEPNKFSEIEMYEKILKESIPEAKQDAERKKELFLAFDNVKKQDAVVVPAPPAVQQEKATKPAPKGKKAKSKKP